MNSFNLYSDVEMEDEKNIFGSQISLSPTPSPQPKHRNIQPEESQMQLEEGKQTNPVVTSKKGTKRCRRDSEEPKNVNKGHWTFEQNKRYHWFLEIHYRHFVNRHMRRMDKIFKTMELFIGSRQAQQCRSHHQKMEKKYLNFTTIIGNLRQLHYGTSNLESLLVDLEENHVQLTQGALATMDELQEQQTIAPIPELKERKRSIVRVDQTIQPTVEPQFEAVAVQEEEKSELMECPAINMLEESHLNINWLVMQHEREENSLFNMF